MPQPDELNKQVFALLLLNRFIGETHFSKWSHGSSASIARESGRTLSNSLTIYIWSMALELNFDLNTSQDFTTGQEENKTDLVGFQKII
jgi:hypothetical protein